MAEHAEEQYDEDFDGWEELPEEKPKVAYSKLIVATCLILILTFTVACMTFYWNGKSVDPVLIGFFFACFGIEFASLAFIKGRDIRYIEGNPANKQMPHVEIEEEKEDE